MSRKQSEDSFSEEETLRRFETALQAGLRTPPVPQKDVPRKKFAEITLS